jgi:hypothetical protein
LVINVAFINPLFSLTHREAEYQFEEQGEEINFFNDDIKLNNISGLFKLNVKY